MEVKLESSKYPGRVDSIVIDDDDADRVLKYHWWADYKKDGTVRRVMAKMKIRECWRTVTLEKFIKYPWDELGEKSLYTRIKHVNGNTADFSKRNLQVDKVFKEALSNKQRFPGLVQSKTLCGVFYDKDYHNFRAKYYVNDNDGWCDLGCYKTADEAAKAWDVKARSMGVPEHLLNFPTM